MDPGGELTAEQLEQLIAHVRACRSQGMADADISTALVDGGWTAPQVAQVWRVVGAPGDAPQPQTQPKKNWSRTCGIGCLALLVVLALIMILGREAQEHTPTAHAPPTEAQQPAAPPPEAPRPISITATDLQKAYSANPVAAKQKYEGKPVLVTGRIEDISIMMGEPHVSMRTGELFWPVTCVFPEEASDAVAKLAKEDRITVRGVVGGEPIGLGVFVEDCELVQ